jgi:hypothetical protein
MSGAHQSLIADLSSAAMLAPEAAGGAPDAVDGPLTARRFDRWAGPIGAGLAGVGLLVLALLLLGAGSSVWGRTSTGWAYDFEAYYNAAQRLVEFGSPYQAATLNGPFRPGPYGLYLYAPPLALLLVPLTWISDNAAAFTWLAIRIGLLAATCALMPVQRWIRAASFGIAALSAPFLLDLNLGNISLVVTFLGVAVWRWLDRPVAGVVLAASLMLRPTMGVVALWWLARGVWRPVAATAVTALAIVALTLPFMDLDVWYQYATVLGHVSNVTGVRSNVDLGSAVLRFGGPEGAASVALFAGYAAAVAAILLSLSRDRELSYVVTLTATLLMAPLLWDHYLTHLIVPAAFLASRGRPWGLLLPLAAWLPFALAAPLNDSAGAMGGLLSVVVLVAMFLPFAAPDRGEPAGTFLDRVRARRATRPARA